VIGTYWGQSLWMIETFLFVSLGEGEVYRNVVWKTVRLTWIAIRRTWFYNFTFLLILYAFFSFFLLLCVCLSCSSCKPWTIILIVVVVVIMIIIYGYRKSAQCVAKTEWYSYLCRAGNSIPEWWSKFKFSSQNFIEEFFTILRFATNEQS